MHTAPNNELHISLARTRTHTELNPVKGQGRVDTPTFPTRFFYDNSVIGVKQVCTDENNRPGQNNGLTIQHDKCNCQALTGVDKPPEGVPGPTRSYAALRPTYFDTPSVGGLDLPPPSSINVDANTVLSVSNPSRPDVDLGITIAELRDAPQLFVRFGHSALKNGADWWLSYSFGWKPFVNDLIDLLSVPEKIQQRANHLKNAASHGYMRRRVKLGEVSNVRRDSVIIESRLGQTLIGRRVTTSTRKRWGTCKWVPRYSNGSIPSTDLERLKAARRAAYGLTVDAYTAWNLIPWSWLVDYFGNMGDYLLANRNTMGLECRDGVCIMTHTTHREQITARLDPHTKIVGGIGSKTSETKRRQVLTFVMPELTIQLLGSGQLSNLSALAINNLPRDALASFDEKMYRFVRGGR